MFISPLWLFEPWRERRGSDAQSAGGGGAWCRSDPLNQLLTGLIPVAEIDRRLAEIDCSRGRAAAFFAADQ
jgi:hypothetical protein